MASDAPFTLRGGVALVTGAAGGIGAALALALARQGMHLALADVRPDGLAATAQQAAALGVTVSQHVLDLADSAALAALPAAVLAQHGRLSLLVNNAGVAVGGTFQQVSEADFDWLMAINFGATVRLTRLLLPTLAKEPAALVVNLSSIFGIIAPPGQTAYAASKFAVRGFSEALRHELLADNSPVRVMLVHPGGVRTDIANHARLPAGAPAEEVARRMADWRKLLALSPEDAAGQILRGIQRRSPRVLVGNDAVGAAVMQRLFPVGYWRHIARNIARRTGQGR